MDNQSYKRLQKMLMQGVASIEEDDKEEIESEPPRYVQAYMVGITMCRYMHADSSMYVGITMCMHLACNVHVQLWYFECF